MTSQRLVEEFAAWLWKWDTGHVGDARIPDNYLNEAAVFLAGELGQRLQRQGSAQAWDEGSEHGWEAHEISGEVWHTDDDPNPYRKDSAS